MSQKKFDPFRRFEEIPSRLYVILAIVAIAAHIVLCEAANLAPALSGLIVAVAYLILSVIVYFVSRRRLDLIKLESDACEEQNDGVV